MTNTALLKLMNLVSPALPVGAYAYSQGQEYAVDAEWIKTDVEVEGWILGVMKNSVGGLELPCLIRLFNGWQESDGERINYWNDFLRANRETRELLLEDEQLGQALGRLLISLEVDSHLDILVSAPSYTTLFALAGVRWDIPLADLLQGFCWAWLENQVAAATKTVPLGQTQGQKILMSLMEHIPGIIARAESLNDDELGVGLPALALASCLHERQYSRLFRS